MNLADDTLAHVTTQAPLPVGWRTEHMTARGPEGVAAMELTAFKFP